ncbi:MAG: hypothetical protein JWM91_5199 [Rhodospirillales bacterium]|nr:hypothetical protein [Rhodospirillales bacterium]
MNDAATEWERLMIFETDSARNILSAFIADVSSGKHGGDPELVAILLEHLLLQGGFKILSREPDERILLAGVRATAPDDIWREIWDAVGSHDLDGDENYTPA